MTHVHIVGAGIAGLACAVRVVKAGGTATLYEAAGQAGGRCRTYYDSQLKAEIDNGNHILLTANTTPSLNVISQTVGSTAVALSASRGCK